MSFAKVTIVGNLGNDPEVRYTPSGSTAVSFSIAADGKPDKEGTRTTTWFRVSAWDRLAERLASLQEKGHIGKGKSLYVEGQLEQRTYTDRNGNPATSLDVTLTDFQFTGSGQQQGQGAYQSSAGDANMSNVPF